MNHVLDCFIFFSEHYLICSVKKEIVIVLVILVKTEHKSKHKLNL